MKIIPLEPSSEPIFWKHVNQDILHYYFFAYDWKYNRSQTEILLASEEDHINGMMLVYDKRIVQLRGSRKSAKGLLKRLDLEKTSYCVLDSTSSTSLRSISRRQLTK